MQDPSNAEDAIVELPLVGLAQVRPEPALREVREFGEQPIVYGTGDMYPLPLGQPALVDWRPTGRSA